MRVARRRSPGPRNANDELCELVSQEGHGGHGGRTTPWPTCPPCERCCGRAQGGMKVTPCSCVSTRISPIAVTVGATNGSRVLVPSATVDASANRVWFFIQAFPE